MYFIICPSCGKKHRYDKPNYDDIIGKKTACKKCGKSWNISINDMEKGPTPIVEETPKEKKSFRLSKPAPISPSFLLYVYNCWVGIKKHFTFKDMMFISWVKASYFISFLFTLLTSIGMFFQYVNSSEKEPLSFALILAPWLALFTLRLIMEFGVVFFSIHEELVELNEKTEKQQ